MTLIHVLEFGLAVTGGYAIYKHFGLATIEADVKAAFAKADATVVSLKAALAKYL